jgi:Na+/H+ antiporter NhaC
MSIVVYTGVGLLILNLRGGSSQAELPYTFYAIAAVLAIGSIVLRRAQLHRMKLEVVAGTRGVEGLIKHLLNATILAAAIAEVIGVLSLVVAFFGGDKSDVIRLGVVAMAVSLYNYPRRSAWQRAVDYFASAKAGVGEGKLGL